MFFLCVHKCMIQKITAVCNLEENYIFSPCRDYEMEKKGAHYTITGTLWNNFSSLFHDI